MTPLKESQSNDESKCTIIKFATFITAPSQARYAKKAICHASISRKSDKKDAGGIHS
jgi:hypothetical protein